MKHIITISGIRPDFIRMSEIFKKLDKNFKHTLIHTGQHFDFNLSGSFFEDLKIREPDYNFSIGKESCDHFDQLAHLSLKIQEHQELIKTADLVLFLGDSNSVLASVLIKKMGLSVGHIEAGMRSGDLKMFEEINRTVADRCSDIHFCYHENYKQKLINENLSPNNIHVVGNTIVEVVKQFIPSEEKINKGILVDIHRQENFMDQTRLNNIIKYVKLCGKKLDQPVYMLRFKRTLAKIEEFGIDLSGINIIDLMSFQNYIKTAYHSSVVISDSGTAQEELAFLKSPVVVPRDFTERWESVYNNCSIMLNVNTFNNIYIDEVIAASKNLTFNTEWLGSGEASSLIVEHIKEYLND